MEYKALEEDVTECTEIRLGSKEEIVKQNASQLVSYNLDLVYMKCSGHYIELSVNDHPASPSTTMTQKYHHNVDILPKPVQVTKNHVEERATDINELD